MAGRRVLRDDVDKGLGSEVAILNLSRGDFLWERMSENSGREEGGRTEAGGEVAENVGHKVADGEILGEDGEATKQAGLDELHAKAVCEGELKVGGR